METSSKKFRELFCEHFRCPLETYEEKMFRLCLYPHAVAFARVIRAMSPRFFEEDLAVIRQLGITISQIEFHDEVKDYFYHVNSYGTFLRRVCRIRISGKRLIRFSNLFAPGVPPTTTQPA